MTALASILAQIGQIVPPEEQGNIATDVAAAGSLAMDRSQGKNARQLLYEELAGQNDKLSAAKADILGRLGQGGEMTKSQTAAMMFIGALPMLIGGLVKGKKGLAEGAKAGALGTSLMAKGINEEQTRADALGLNQLKGIESQQGNIADTMNRAKLDELNAVDRATENEKDRANARTTASIRAGGDHAIAKTMMQQLNLMSKKIDVDKKATEQAANKEHLELGDTVYVATTKTEDDRKEIRELKTHYGILLKELTNMRQTSAGAQYGGVSRVFGDPAKPLERSRANAMKALEQIKKVPGTMSNAGLQKLDKILVDPSSLTANLADLWPFGENIHEQLKGTQDMIADDLALFYNSKGAVPKKIGSKITTEAGDYYLIGVDPDSGKMRYTQDLNAVNDKLVGLGYPEIGAE